MAKKLTAVISMAPEEVSLVDRGANRKKRFSITKSEDLMHEEILKAVLETEVEEEKQFKELLEKAELSDKGKAATQAAIRLLASFKDELPEGLLEALADIVGPGQSEEETPEAEMAETDKEETEKMAPEEGDESMNEEVQKQLKSRDLQLVELKKQNEEFQKALKTERDARELAVWVAKAEADLGHYPGKSSEELGAMLKTLHDASPEIAKVQFEQMKTASEALKESTLLKSAGSAGGSDSGSDAWAKIEKRAEGVIEKSSTILNKAQAIAKVIEMNPEMYSEYLDENPKQTGN